MAVLPRDVDEYVDPNEVAYWVEISTIGAYLCTVVAAGVVYDAGERSSVKSFRDLTFPLTVRTLDKEVS